MDNIRVSSLLCALLIMLTLSSCELAGDIFKAGAWTGIILVILVIAIIVWIIKKVIS